MEKKIVEAMVFNDLFRGVKFFYETGTELREVTSIKEITQKIMVCDPNLIIDASCCRPEIKN